MNKTLIVGMTPPLEGGSERHILEISSRIKNSFVLTQKGSICENKIEVRTYGSGIIKNISFCTISFLYLLTLLVRRKKYELIHIHENLLYFAAPFLRLRYNVIITVHGITGFKFYDNKILWFFFKNSLKFANSIISVSLTDKDLLRKEFKKVIYIPNGVDTLTYRKISSQKIKKEIAFVGRIHEQKGIEYLIKAFQSIKSDFPDYKLKIIGKKEGALYNRLHDSSNNDSVIWKGFILDRKELFKELASAKVLVFPSLWEALPWPALLEGLASGRPVIASNLKGMDRIFKNNRDIILIKPANEKEIELAIRKIIFDEKLQSTLGRNAEKVILEYSWDSIAGKVEKLYKLYLA